MRKLLIQLLIICTVSNTAYADVVYIEKDTPAPFAGYLFDPKAGRDVKTKLVDLEYFQKLSESLQKQVTLLEAVDKRNEEKLGIVSDRNDKLAKSLNAERSMSDLERVLYFGGGILATILVLYGVQRIAK